MGPLLSGVTIFLGAFLLFQVQPVIAKTILPWFGGSAAVWTTCMLFFQAILFLGYLYAHWLNRKLTPQWQARVHITALLLSLAALPVIPGAAWKPAGAEDPIPRILGLLAATVGLPYFLLSSTSPLVQAWYSRRSHAALPYRYFALSNLASLAALLGYPTVVERWTTLRHQALGWSFGYGAFVVLCAAVAWGARTGIAPAPEADERESPPLSDRIMWLMFAALPSMLTLAVTNHLCQNVASIPFLWVLPLAVYLLTFILCFDREQGYPRGALLGLHAAALGGLAFLLVKQTPSTSIKLVIPILTIGLFLSCMCCHGELARRRPSPRHLTNYYLMIALGGALGSALVGLLAPYLLRGYYELPLGLALCAIFTLLLEYRKSLVTDLVWMGVAVATVVVANMQIQSLSAQARVMGRNFYGGLRVVDADGKRSMIHGTICHGAQFLAPARRREPTTYYAPGAGVQLALQEFRHSPQRVGLIGLGAGTLAAYGQPGDTYRYYEINPMVADLARREFTFLSDSAARTDVVLGDGRLSLEREESQQFDVLVVDAFSGDSIPVHLLSREAFEVYFRHLKPDGAVALHVSNSALNLAPLVAKTAESLGKAAVRIHSPPDPRLDRYEADWMLVAASPALLDRPAFRAAAKPATPIPGLLVWTDDYSSLFPLLK